VIGRHEDPIDARGEAVFLLGSCAKANIVNAKKINHLDKCFSTAADMNLAMGHKLGIPTITRNPGLFFDILWAAMQASARKMVNMRYLQDISHFIKKGLLRRI